MQKCKFRKTSIQLFCVGFPSVGGASLESVAVVGVTTALRPSAPGIFRHFKFVLEFILFFCLFVRNAYIIVLRIRCIVVPCSTISRAVELLSPPSLGGVDGASRRESRGRAAWDCLKRVVMGYFGVRGVVVGE